MRTTMYLLSRITTVHIALTLLPLLLVSAGFDARVPRPVLFTIKNLGTFGGSTRASGLNDRGQVAGYSFGTPSQAHAFRYTEGIGLLDLSRIANNPNTYGAGINKSGQVSGSIDRSAGAGGYHAYRFTDGVGLVDLGSLPGYRFSYGGPINKSGQVAGTAYGHDPDMSRAYRYTDGTGMEDLGSLVPGRSSFVEGMNNAGHVVGTAEVLTTPPGYEWNPGHAFLYRSRRGMQDLNKMIDTSLDWELRRASAISDEGQIVGFGEHKGVGVRAYRFHNGKVKDLGTFPGGGISYALGINNRGDVVGAAYLDASGAGNFRAMLYTDARGIQNLNDLIDPSLGWVLRKAVAINNRGQIAGWGELKGEERAFLLTPNKSFQ